MEGEWEEGKDSSSTNVSTQNSTFIGGIIKTHLNWYGGITRQGLLNKLSNLLCICSILCGVQYILVKT